MLDERTIPDLELPTWMRQARRGIDWGVIIVMVMSIFIAWPFITNTTLPRFTNMEHAGFQVNEASSSFLQGWVFPRWSATAIYGYGAPLPNFLPSAGPQVAAALNVLFLNDVERAVRLTMIGAFLLAGGTVYVIVTQRSGARAGVLAASLYLFSPYVGLMTPYVRGDLPGMLAMAALPTLLWAVNRLLLRDQRLDSVMIALTTAFILLNDPVWLLLAQLPLVTLATYNARVFGQWRKRGIIVGSMLLGIGLAAPFWLPAIIERDSVRWIAPLVGARSEPISFTGLFARTEALDPGSLVHYPQWNLGWVLLIFLGIGVLAMLRHPKHTGLERAFALIGVVSVGLAVWLLPDNHRLIGLATFCFAIAASASVQLMRHLRRWQEVVIAPLMLLTVVGIAYPLWVQVPDTPGQSDFSQAAQLRYEREGNGISTLAAGQMIPTTLTEAAIADLEPVAVDATSQAINRFASVQSTQFQLLAFSRGTVPVTVEGGNRAGQGIHFSAYSVATAQRGTYLYEQSFFEGWQALLNETPVPLERDEATGKTIITLPDAQNATLLITMGSTPARLVAWGISGFALLALVVYTAIRWRMAPGSPEDSILLRRPLARMLLLAALFALVLRVFPGLNPLRGTLAPEPQHNLGLYVPYRNIYEGAIDLTRYCYTTTLRQELRVATPATLPPEVCRPGQNYEPGSHITLELIWELRQASSAQYMVALQLISGATNENLYAEPLRHPGHLPTNRWSERTTVPDRYTMILPPEIELGAYNVEITLYRCEPSAPGLYPACEGIEQRLSLPEPIVID